MASNDERVTLFVLKQAGAELSNGNVASDLPLKRDPTTCHCLDFEVCREKRLIETAMDWQCSVLLLLGVVARAMAMLCLVNALDCSDQDNEGRLPEANVRDPAASTT